MRWKLKKTVLLTLAVGVCAQVGCAVPGSVKNNDVSDGVECILLNHADIFVSDQIEGFRDEMTDGEILAMANHGHSIIGGEFVVISIREFIGSQFPDGQAFRKLTLKMGSDDADESTREVLESYFSTGSSGFIEKGFFYYSWGQVKSVQINLSKEQLQLHVDQSLPSVRAIDGRRDDIAVRFSCVLQRAQVDQLTPWEGKVESGRAAFYPPKD